MSADIPLTPKPQHQVGAKAYWAGNVTGIKPCVITQVQVTYTKDDTYVFYKYMLDGKEQASPYAHGSEDNSDNIYFSLEEAQEAVAENIQWRKDRALKHYEEELAQIAEYETSSLVTTQSKDEQ